MHIFIYRTTPNYYFTPLKYILESSSFIREKISNLKRVRFAHLSRYVYRSNKSGPGLMRLADESFVSPYRSPYVGLFQIFFDTFQIFDYLNHSRWFITYNTMQIGTVWMMIEHVISQHVPKIDTVQNWM